MKSSSFKALIISGRGIAATGGLISLLLACGNPGARSQNANTTEQGAQPSVETQAPNTRYQPAFPGQTRAPRVSTSTPFRVEQLTSGLQRPWSVNPLPDGRLLIGSILGYLTIHDADGRELKRVTGLPKVLVRGQGGLLDVVPHPDFANNRLLFWSYSETYGNANLMAVARGRLSADETTVEDVQVIFRAKPELQSSLHFGSRIVFTPEGYLFVSTGERSVPEGRKQAQWLNSGLGKIFRITTDGKPAPGNPFEGRADALPEIWSYGNRNVQSLDLHPETGDLWEAEFGPRGGDELNRILPGRNYGWPTITYGIEYSGIKVGQGITQQAGMEQPVYYWDPSISPSGMAFYRGDGIPEWKNNLFIGCLSGLHIARIVLRDNKVVGEERLLTDKQERFRDVTFANGKLYAVTDNGSLYRIGKE